MAGNPNPIYSRVGAISLGSAITAVVTDYTGIGTNNVVAFTADATNGGFIQRIRFKAAGTNAVSVARIYLNNGSTNTSLKNFKCSGSVKVTCSILARIIGA